VVLSPAAGVFYWKKGRERAGVTENGSLQKAKSQSSQITVIAHRDELAELLTTVKTV